MPCMPLYWTIDSKERLFTGRGEGNVTFAAARSLLDALAGAGALSYRKLFMRIPQLARLRSFTPRRKPLYCATVRGLRIFPRSMREKVYACFQCSALPREAGPRSTVS
jgi:hypothetical protein